MEAATVTSERIVRANVNRSTEELVPREVLDLLIRRECARADRNGREFSLVLFRVKNQKRTSVSTQRLARTILNRARLTDEVGWFSDHYICALLPDTSVNGAQIFMNSVCDLVERKAARPLAVVYSYPGNLLTSEDMNLNNNNHRNDRFDDNDHRNNGGKRMHAAGERVATVFRSVNDSVDETATPKIGEMNRADLMPALASGLAGEHAEHTLPASSIHDFLVHPMPTWKRAFDLFVGLVVFACFLPFMAVIALIMKIMEPKDPIFYCQARAGLGGKPFHIYKFRTMIVGADKKVDELRARSEQDGPAFKMKNDPRITPFGRFLRKTSLDELPQLINVIKGDMSLVGPRPLPIKEAENCLQWQRRRLDVTPGLTCIWQVKGRSTVTFAEWIRMDVEYIRRRTIFHDLSLLVMTVPAVLLRRGAK